MELPEAVRIGIRAAGLHADSGQMPVNELIVILPAVANITRRATLPVAARKLSAGPTDLSSVQVLVRSPQSGSFIVELTVQIGTNIAANLATHLILGTIRRVYRAAVGWEDTRIAERIEPSLPWPERQTEPSPPSRDEIAELSETLHPSFEQLSRPIGESATTISLFDASQPYKHGSELFTIDPDAKEELSHEVVGSIIEVFGGRVRALNDRTRKGIFDLDQPRPRDLPNLMRSVRFWIDEYSNQQQIVSALAANLAINNAAGEASRRLTVKARRVTTRTGRVKRILIEGLA